MERVPKACASFTDIIDAFVSFIANVSCVIRDLYSPTYEKFPFPKVFS